MTLCTTPLPAEETAGSASVIRDDWVRQAVAQNENRPFTAEDDAAGGCDGIKDGTAGFHTQKQQDPWENGGENGKNRENRENRGQSPITL